MVGKIFVINLLKKKRTFIVWRSGWSFWGMFFVFTRMFLCSKRYRLCWTATNRWLLFVWSYSKGMIGCLKINLLLQSGGGWLKDCLEMSTSTLQSTGAWNLAYVWWIPSSQIGIQTKITREAGQTFKQSITTVGGESLENQMCSSTGNSKT